MGRFGDKEKGDEALNSQDQDCSLTILQDNKPITNLEDINFEKEITLIIGSSVEGYSLTTENVVNGKNLKAGEPFKLVPQKKKDPIIISYGSDDENKRNKKNIITIKPQ